MITKRPPVWIAESLSPRKNAAKSEVRAGVSTKRGAVTLISISLRLLMQRKRATDAIIPTKSTALNEMSVKEGKPPIKKNGSEIRQVRMEWTAVYEALLLSCKTCFSEMVIAETRSEVMSA
jgi:hypothetical protein